MHEADWDLEQDGLERGEPEPFRYETSKCADAGRRDGEEHEHEPPHPSLWVDERLPDLVPFPLGRLCAGIVRTKTFHRDGFFALVEEPSRLDVVGHHPHEKRSENDGDAPEKDENGLVWLDLVADVTDAKGEQGPELLRIHGQ